MNAKALPKRRELPEQYTWNLDTVYAGEAQWERDFQRVKEQTPKLQACAGTLADSAEQLLSCLALRDGTQKQLEHLLVYSHMRKDEDNANGHYQELNDRATTLATEFSSAVSFFTPEILGIPDGRLRSFLAEEPGLAVYRHHLDNLLRQKAHVRTAEVESVLAQVAEISRTAGNSYTMLTNADMKFPTIEDEEGNPIELSQSRYNQLRESHDRRVRKDAFEKLHGTFYQYRNTLAANLAGSVRSDVFYARARNYPTALEAALSPDNIPTAVYHSLVESVQSNLPRLHRYMSLRKRLLGLDELHHYDLYVPMVPEVQLEVKYEDGKGMVRDALAKMGPEYQSALDAALTSRWIDVYENEGKTSGAYSDGGYTTNPFILMNYQDTLSDVFTLAHELGHSMHSFFTRGTQPYIYGDYTIFVAEVASTVNESLLNAHLLEQTNDPKLRAYLVNRHLETFRTTLFRQTMFAEFELITHTRAESGQALTPDILSSIYADLNKKYYGPEVVLDGDIAIEWARIPHFYRAFYVYQYATGLSAATALSRQVMMEGEPAVGRYLGFLKSGSSKYSIDILRDAGVDVTTPEPVQQALNVFDELLTEMEKLQGSAG